MQTIEEKINHMKKMAEFLTSYSAPNVSMVEDKEILPLKVRRLTIDGYDIILMYNITLDKEKNQRIEFVQIQAVKYPFLPFNLICKLGKLFLGTKKLSYFELFIANRKLYVWAIRRKNNKLISPKNVEKFSYEGLDFSLLNPQSINLLYEE